MNRESQDKKEFVIDRASALQSETQMQSQLIESGGEFVLPDYMPKIQKVLRLEARALPPSRYVGGNSVQMSGNVLHTLIYLGEDGETGATVLPSKYEFSLPVSGTPTPTVTSSVEVDGLTYRITAPRKLNIRTRLGIKSHCFAAEDVSADITPVDALNVSKLYGVADTLKTQILNSSDIQISDRVETSGADGSRLLWCGSAAAVTDARATDGGVTVRGEVLAKVLVDENGTPRMYTKKIPFDEFLDGDVTRASAVCAVAHVISTEAAKESDREVTVDSVISVEVTADTPTAVSVMKDAFSCDVSASCSHRTVKSSRLALSRSGVYTVGASVAKANAGAAEATSVIDTSGKAVIEESAASAGKITVSGRCELSSIIGTDGGVTSADYTVPFSIALDCDTSADTAVTACATLINPRVRVEDDNLVCDMDIALSVRATQEKEERILASVDCTSKEQYKKSTYPLCLIYPNGESLWNLAKKYHVNPESLAKVNALEISESDYTRPEALSGVRSLMLEFK
ncbi:MAG: DUF3794 domain-containing protein [Clostridia bacterium]|nr:DUF3794 domain-containing protein [Clostridia bacterium]